MTSHSRTRRISGMLEACNPFSRPRSASTSASHAPLVQAHLAPSGSPAPSTPNSFRSNVAVVDGPAAGAGYYYGVFLGEPPKNFPSSSSSVQGSPGGSRHSSHSRSQSMQSMGTSGGSHQTSKDQINARSKHSSVAFPVAATSVPASIQPQPQPQYQKQQEVVSSHTRSRHTSFTAVPSAHVTPVTHVYHAHDANHHQTQQNPSTIKVAAQVPFHRVSAVPPSKQQQSEQQPQQSNMPPSALKRERRQTFSYSSSSSEEIPANTLRMTCKFLIGSANECQKIRSNEPIFSRLRKTTRILNRMYDCLGSMVHEQDLLTTADSNQINGVLRELQALLIRCVQPRPFNPYRIEELDEYYNSLISFVKRLESTLQIRDIQSKINELTYQHNVSQAATLQIHKEADRLKADPRASRSHQRTTIRDKRTELDVMHEERVAIREEISKLKKKLSSAKQERDVLLGIKTVRFQ